MNKIKKITAVGVMAVLAAFAITAFIPSSFASASDLLIAVNDGEAGGGGGGTTPTTGGTTPTTGGTGSNKAAKAAKDGFKDVNKTVGASDDLHSSVGVILNIVYSIIGIVAVVMVVIGGVSYATSQGDPGRLKKAKDTILYGIIGLVIVLMAFAITNFVLTALAGGQ